MVDSNSWLERQRNGPQKASNVYPTAQKPMETSQNVIYRDLEKNPWGFEKVDSRAENRVLSRKWPETDVFREVIKFETVWPEDLPWWCYDLKYGRYVEKKPLEWRNVSFCPSEWLTVILGWKGNETARKRHGTCTLWPKNQWKPHKMSSTRIWKNLGGFEKSWPGC
jgi:hypothetical protein